MLMFHRWTLCVCGLWVYFDLKQVLACIQLATVEYFSIYNQMVLIHKKVKKYLEII